ncbi:hypothetical protein [Nostoc sp. LEGE 12450]|uniref:hypothetical protein n=1 Tax=Nostoc sp. LEGE 12450 TaxID=1828643 RepID=UPI001882580C|nr:hypothetical protein [Nostoc sp. LEGE 12450]MBE8987577.1 hypothetical protein [Nostoc sp. LEGE 12450]
MKLNVIFIHIITSWQFKYFFEELLLLTAVQTKNLWLRSILSLELPEHSLNEIYVQILAQVLILTKH